MDKVSLSSYSNPEMSLSLCLITSECGKVETPIDSSYVTFFSLVFEILRASFVIIRIQNILYISILKSLVN